MSWNPFKDPAAEDRRLMLLTLEKQHEQTLAAMNGMNQTAGKMADAAKAQAESFTAYLSLFKVQSPPEARVMRDEDEYREELKRSGFPVDADAETQAKWVLAQSE